MYFKAKFFSMMLHLKAILTPVSLLSPVIIHIFIPAFFKFKSVFSTESLNSSFTPLPPSKTCSFSITRNSYCYISCTFMHLECSVSFFSLYKKPKLTNNFNNRSNFRKKCTYSAMKCVISSCVRILFE